MPWSIYILPGGGVPLLELVYEEGGGVPLLELVVDEGGVMVRWPDDCSTRWQLNKSKFNHVSEKNLLNNHLKYVKKIKKEKVLYNGKNIF